jgi:hypothetical protein
MKISPSFTALSLTLVLWGRIASAEAENPRRGRHGQANRWVSAAGPASAPAKGTEDAWSAGYAEARALMLAGHFSEAALRFEALMLSAPDLGSRILATEMDSACRTWARGGFVLATPTQVASAAILEDRRTSDEIAILYTSAVLYGLYSGVVLDVLSKPGDPSGAILPVLLLGGLSAGAVAALDHNLHLRYGVAQSIVSGMYIGFEEGIAWSLWHEASSPRRSELGPKAVTSLIWGMGTLGAVTGGIVGTSYGTTPGRASLMGSAAMWSGLVSGTLAGGLTDTDDWALLTSAIALNVGAVAGAILGAEVSPSIARVRFLDLGGLSGGLLGGGLYLAMQDRDPSAQGLLMSTSLGMAAGLVTSWLLTRDMETDLPRKRREPSLADRLIPTLVPASTGTGMVLGVAATI